MALTIAAGVGLALLLPRSGPPAPVELARPAPVANPEPRASWAAPAQPPAADPQAVAVEPAAPPPLRTHRLVAAQVARPHAAKPLRLATARGAAKLPPPPPCPPPASVADRLVCERPLLAAQDRAMRAAYERALASGANELRVDREQAKWRGRRDRATSEVELAQLYAARIAELDKFTPRRRPATGAQGV